MGEKKQKVIFNLKLNGAQPKVLCVSSLAVLEAKKEAGLRLFLHHQPTTRGDALVSHAAEEAARRLAGIFGEHLEMTACWKPFTQFPQIDRVDRHAQIGGDLLQGNLILTPPILKREGEAFADIAFKLRFFGHALILQCEWLFFNLNYPTRLRFTEPHTKTSRKIILITETSLASRSF